MTNPIPIAVIVEDDVSLAVALRLVENFEPKYLISYTSVQNGFGKIKKMINAFNKAARSMPYLVLTDLDEAECAPTLCGTWLPNVKQHPNLLLRVAVREVEAWLLADQKGLAKFLGIKQELVPSTVEEITDPKKELIKLASKSPYKEIRKDIIPPQGSKRVQGPNYNGRLSVFVKHHWNLDRASDTATSLLKMREAIETFAPTWQLQGEN